jgi:hypothetical protein
VSAIRIARKGSASEHGAGAVVLHFDATGLRATVDVPHGQGRQFLGGKDGFQSDAGFVRPSLIK